MSSSRLISVNGIDLFVRKQGQDRPGRRPRLDAPVAWHAANLKRKLIIDSAGH